MLFIIILLMLVVFVGITMNFVVIVENSGKMPVLSAFIYETDEHFSYQEKSEIEYWFLSDMIEFQGSVSSIGDIIMILGFLSVMGIILVSLITKRWSIFKK